MTAAEFLAMYARHDGHTEDEVKSSGLTVFRCLCDVEGCPGYAMHHPDARNTQLALEMGRIEALETQP